MNVICYVDGFNLYHGLRSKGLQRYYWLDLWKLTERFLLPNQELQELVYCTSRVKKNPPSRKKQRLYTDALEAFRPKTKMLYGQYLAKEVRCRRCGLTYLRHEEKMTDVNIACELLQDAMDGRFDIALVISGDSDLVPPIRKIKKLYPEKQVITLFPPNRDSKALKKNSHGYKWISEADLTASQLPEVIEVPNRQPLLRPKKWH